MDSRKRLGAKLVRSSAMAPREAGRLSTGLAALDVQLGGSTRLTRTGCVSDYGLVRPSFVVLSGEPMVGRSRVVWEIIRNVSGACHSVLCVSESLRVDDEVRANVAVMVSRKVRTLAQIDRELTRHPRSVLVLDGLASVCLDEPLPRLRQRTSTRLSVLCNRVCGLARKHNLCILGTSRPGVAEMRHTADAVIELTEDGAGGVKFQSTKNRFSRSLQAA